MVSKISGARTRPIRERAPFNSVDGAHSIIKACEAMGWDLSNPAQFLKQVQHVEYGLSAESEFAAILSWLGRCRLAHRFDQGQFVSGRTTGLKVPDLFAVIEHEGRAMSCVIEVKTTEQSRLTLKCDYLRALSDYAAIAKQPLLIAWKPRSLGSWLLIDPSVGTKAGNKIEFDLSSAVGNDLMGVIAGDFYVVPKSGAGIFFDAKILTRTHETKNGFQALCHIERAEFRDADGQPVKKLPQSIVSILFATMECADRVEGDRVIHSYISNGGLIRSQDILRFTVGWQLEADKRIHWKLVAEKLQDILSVESISRDVRRHFGSFIQYQLHQTPKAWPIFLAKAWKKTAPSTDRARSRRHSPSK